MGLIASITVTDRSSSHRSHRRDAHDDDPDHAADTGRQRPVLLHPGTTTGSRWAWPAMPQRWSWPNCGCCRATDPVRSAGSCSFTYPISITVALALRWLDLDPRRSARLRVGPARGSHRLTAAIAWRTVLAARRGQLLPAAARCMPQSC